MICVQESYYAPNYIQSQFNYQKKRKPLPNFFFLPVLCVRRGRRRDCRPSCVLVGGGRAHCFAPPWDLKARGNLERPRRRAGGYRGLRAVLTIGWDYLGLPDPAKISDPAKICHGRDFLMASVVDLKSRTISSIPSIASSASTSHPLLTSPAPPRSPTSRTRTSVASDLSHWSSLALAG